MDNDLGSHSQYVGALCDFFVCNFLPHACIHFCKENIENIATISLQSYKIIYKLAARNEKSFKNPATMFNDKSIKVYCQR